MSDVQDQEKLYDPQIAPFIDKEADEVTQIGPDGKRHPVSELTHEERSASKVVAEGDAAPGSSEAKPDKPGSSSDAGEGDKPDSAKAAASRGAAAGSGK